MNEKPACYTLQKRYKTHFVTGGKTAQKRYKRYILLKECNV